MKEGARASNSFPQFPLSSKNLLVPTANTPPHCMPGQRKPRTNFQGSSVTRTSTMLLSGAAEVEGASVSAGEATLGNFE